MQASATLRERHGLQQRAAHLAGRPRNLEALRQPQYLRVISKLRG